MKIQKLLLALTLLLSFFHRANAQLREGFKAEIEAQAIGTTNGVVPFWMRSNQFGSVPLAGASGSIIGRFSKDYEELSQSDKIYGRSKLTDWGFGIEARANGGKGSNADVIQAYVKGKLSIFQLQVGRTKDVLGLNGDTALSSGNFAISGNALGIPKVELSIPDYFTLPILNGIISFKGAFSHGYFGRVRILDSIKYDSDHAQFVTTNNYPITYLHQKSLYGRLGHENWKLKIYGGFSHQAVWGNEKAAYGEKFALSPVETFIYVATGRAYDANGIPRSKIGNQIGSIDIGAEYEFENFKVMLYRQNFYDVGALSKLANIADGLNGIRFENLNYNSTMSAFKVKTLLFEVFYTKDQAGYPWSTRTASGDEDYYNNYYYVDGWSYKGEGLGNPLITPKKHAKKGQATRNLDYFNNNRVIALHLGINGELNNIGFTTKMTYSWNYGSFGNSKYGNSTGPIFYPQREDLFEPVQQFSAIIQANKDLKENLNAGISLSGDAGNLLPYSAGIQIHLLKRF